MYNNINILLLLLSLFKINASRLVQINKCPLCELTPYNLRWIYDKQIISENTKACFIISMKQCITSSKYNCSNTLANSLSDNNISSKEVNVTINTNTNSLYNKRNLKKYTHTHTATPIYKNTPKINDLLIAVNNANSVLTIFYAIGKADKVAERAGLDALIVAEDALIAATVTVLAFSHAHFPST